MNTLGIDFSHPRASKPITCIEATLDDLDSLRTWICFEAFDAALRRPADR